MDSKVLDAIKGTQAELCKIIEDYKYENVPDNFLLGNCNDTEYFQSKFWCHDKADLCSNFSIEESSIVTGFGPTSTPTAGTLSVMLKAIALQRETGIFTEVIISDLGAWNSRNLPWQELKENTRKFLEFMKEIGFNTKNGNLRSHVDKDLLFCSGIITKVLKEEDFKENKEATDMLYDLMNLRGSFLSIMLDGTYTVADIILPLLRGKKSVLVLAGIEEHYFCQLSRLVIERMNKIYPGEFFDKSSHVGAVYTHLVEGLYPYPKMSKSIPESSINIGDSEKILEQKIVNCKPENDHVIFQMINLVSDWERNKIDSAKLSFINRFTNPNNWRSVKYEYFGYFYNLASIWQKL